MSVVSNCAFTQPYSIGHPQVSGEGFLVILRGHARVAYLDVCKQPLLGHQYHSIAIDLDSAPFQHQAPAVVLAFGFGARESGDALDHLSDIGVLAVVVVLGPRVEPPVDQLDDAIGSIDSCGCRVAQPDAIVGRDVQPILVGAILHAVRRNQLTRALGDGVVVTENFHPLELAEGSNYL